MKRLVEQLMKEVGILGPNERLPGVVIEHSFLRDWESRNPPEDQANCL